MKKLLLPLLLLSVAACGHDPDPWDNPRPDGKVFKFSYASERGLTEYYETTESNCTMLRALELSANPGAVMLANCVPVDMDNQDM